MATGETWAVKSSKPSKHVSTELIQTIRNIFLPLSSVNLYIFLHLITLLISSFNRLEPEFYI